MKLSRKSVKPFKSIVTFGLNRHYSHNLIPKEEIISEIQDYQNKLIDEKSIYLSISISESLIVLSGQKEPHLILSFINYPKFPISEMILKNEIENLTKKLMQKFQQNRVVIEYLDETIMFEHDEIIDPSIKKI